MQVTALCYISVLSVPISRCSSHSPGRISSGGRTCSLWERLHPTTFETVAACSAPFTKMLLAHHSSRAYVAPVTVDTWWHRLRTTFFTCRVRRRDACAALTVQTQASVDVGVPGAMCFQNQDFPSLFPLKYSPSGRVVGWSTMC